MKDIRPALHYPVVSTELRRYCARNDICPQCGGGLDTGWQCNSCKYDAGELAQPGAVVKRIGSGRR